MWPWALSYHTCHAFMTFVWIHTSLTVTTNSTNSSRHISCEIGIPHDIKMGKTIAVEKEFKATYDVHVLSYTLTSGKYVRAKCMTMNVRKHTNCDGVLEFPSLPCTHQSKMLFSRAWSPGIRMRLYRLIISRLFASNRNAHTTYSLNHFLLILCSRLKMCLRQFIRDFVTRNRFLSDGVTFHVTTFILTFIWLNTSLREKRVDALIIPTTQ